MNGEINWGPEIRVDGVRPAWLGDGPQPMMVHNAVGWHTWRSCQVDPALVAWSFNTDKPNVDLIRLPVDHPHYAAQQPRTAPNGGEMGPEVVERMVALVRRVSGHDVGFATVDEARAIVALLPEPVDGDLLEARSIAQATVPVGSKVYYLDGSQDDHPIMVAALAGIKLGRALAGERGTLGEGE